jgi:hypothetical protein
MMMRTEVYFKRNLMRVEEAQEKRKTTLCAMRLNPTMKSNSIMLITFTRGSAVGSYMESTDSEHEEEIAEDIIQ